MVKAAVDHPARALAAADGVKAQGDYGPEKLGADCHIIKKKGP